MSFLQLYRRVVALLAPERGLAITLVLANVALAAITFLGPLLVRLRAERDRLDAAIEGLEQRRDLNKAGAAQAGLAEAGLKRSQLTPLQKSQIIREHGREVYNTIPWD